VKRLLLILFILALAVPALSQQGKEFVGNMYSVTMINDREAWACGERGVVNHTKDGGLTWVRQPVNTINPLLAISFFDNKTGWAVGKRGVIFHTNDGGKSWTEQKGPKNKALFAVKALSAEKAFAAGDWGTLLYTEDAGRTWQDRTFPKDFIAYSIDFIGDEGWLAGEMGMLFHTTDAGKTWTQMPMGIESTIYGISMASKKDGLVVGLDGVILKTTDGGKTWKPIVYEDPDRRALYEVRMIDTIAVASGDAGKVITSKDGGLTWSQVHLPIEMNLMWFRSVAMAKGPKGIKGIVVGRQSGTMITLDDRMEAVGVMPKVSKGN